MMASYVERGRLEQMPSFIEDGDMERIAAPIDFLGLNYYTTVEVTPSEDERDDPEGPPSQNPSEGYTEMGWRVDPDGLRSYLSELNNRYSPKSIVVTENGASYSDSPDGYGHIEDQRRIDYLDQHINALLHAAEDGVPIDGYFVWSLLDNLEWTQGFEQRFGLVWVDQESQERTPKRSFEWFGSVVDPDSPESVALAIARNG
jgi:beta-glucosidase